MMNLGLLFRFVLLATLMGIASNLWMNQRAQSLQTHQAALIKERQAVMGDLHLLWSELEALNTMVKAFTVNKDSMHMVNYYELIDLHSGTRSYNARVHPSHWEALIMRPKPAVVLHNEPGPTLQARLQQAFLRVEPDVHKAGQAVKEVLTHYKSLREREQIVFALTQGLYDPVRKQFVSEAPARDDLALQMLFSEQHLQMSMALKLQLTEMISKADTRFHDALRDQSVQIGHTVHVDLVLGVIITLSVLLGLMLLQRDVVKPLKALSAVNQQLTKGEYQVVLPKPGIISEVTELIDGYGRMVGAFKRELDNTIARQNAELAALQASMAQERAEAKAHAKGQLLANMSHEIRTPMNAILGMTALALKSDLPPKERNYLIRVEEAAQSLLGLLNDVLDLSKAEAGMMQFEHIPFQLNEVLSGAFLAVQTECAQKNILLLSEFDNRHTLHAAAHLLGDPARIKQILVNLLSNAVKFTEQGNIMVRASIETIQLIDGHMANLNLEVQDTGSGMTELQAQRIFDKYQQADASISRRYGGTGLGLSISRELCKRMGGCLTVKSELNKGSSFRLTLPLELAASYRLLPAATHGAKLGKAWVCMASGPGQSSVVLLLKAMGFVCALQPDIHDWMQQIKEQMLQNDDVREADSTSNDDFANHAVAHQLLVLQSDHPMLNPIVREQSVNFVQLMETAARAGFKTLAIDPHFVFSESPLRGLPYTIHDPFYYSHHPLLIGNIHQALRENHTMPLPNVSLPNSSVSQHPALQGAHILVIEDHPVNCELMSHLLTQVGAQFILVHNGEEAKTWLETLPQPRVDAIITDLEMPDMDGYALVQWLRQHTAWKNTPVLAISGHAFLEARQRCKAVGMNAFLAKPVHAEELYKVLGQLLLEPVEQH